MFITPITYEDFDGNEVTETFHFHLSKARMIDIQVEYGDEDAFATTLQNIVNEKDNKKIMAEFKKLLMASYGVRSEDGKRFIQSDEMSEAFVQTPAYDELLMKFLQDANFAGDFVNGVFPRDVARRIAEQEATQQTELPPPPTQ